MARAARGRAPAGCLVDGQERDRCPVQAAGPLGLRDHPVRQAGAVEQPVGEPTQRDVPQDLHLLGATVVPERPVRGRRARTTPARTGTRAPAGPRGRPGSRACAPRSPRWPWDRHPASTSRSAPSRLRRPSHARPAARRAPSRPRPSYLSISASTIGRSRSSSGRTGASGSTALKKPDGIMPAPPRTPRWPMRGCYARAPSRPPVVEPVETPGGRARRDPPVVEPVETPIPNHLVLVMRPPAECRGVRW